MEVPQNEYFDVIIIGGGPIGLACAIEAQKNGYAYLILEKGTIVNLLYHYPQGMTFKLSMVWCLQDVNYSSYIRIPFCSSTFKGSSVSPSISLRSISIVLQMAIIGMSLGLPEKGFSE